MRPSSATETTFQDATLAVKVSNKEAGIGYDEIYGVKLNQW